MKKSNKIIGIFSIIAVLIISVLVYYAITTETDSFTFYNEETGYVDVVFKDRNIYTALFGRPLQQSFFHITSAEVGERVQIYDAFSGGDLAFADKIIFRVKRNGGNYGIWEASVPVKDFSEKYVFTYFTPNREGSYRVTGEIWRGNNPIYKYEDGNTLTVTTPEEECNKNPKEGEWEQYKQITGGVQERKPYYGVNEVCEYFTRSTDKRTNCDAGYVISGTNSQSASGYKSCEEIDDGEDPDPVVCTEDKKLTCPDGSIIVDKLCISNEWVDAGNNCGIDVNYIKFYRFENNRCTEYLLLNSQKTANDYTTEAECEANIQTDNNPDVNDTDDDGFDFEDFDVNDLDQNILIGIGAGLIAIGGLALFLRRR